MGGLAGFFVSGSVSKHQMVAVSPGAIPRTRIGACSLRATPSETGARISVHVVFESEPLDVAEVRRGCCIVTNLKKRWDE